MLILGSFVIIFVMFCLMVAVHHNTTLPPQCEFYEIVGSSQHAPTAFLHEKLLLSALYSYCYDFFRIVVVILLSHDLFRSYCGQISLVVLQVYSFVHLWFDRQIHSCLNRYLHVDSRVTQVQLRPNFRMSHILKFGSLSALLLTEISLCPGNLPLDMSVMEMLY